MRYISFSFQCHWQYSCGCVRRKLASTSFPLGCNVVVTNEVEILLEGMLACTIFPSWCNAFVTNALVLVLKGRITCSNFSYSRL